MHARKQLRAYGMCGSTLGPGPFSETEYLEGWAAGRLRRWLGGAATKDKVGHVCSRVGQLDYGWCHAVSPTPTLYTTCIQLFSW